jgi:hypothetical protein
MPAWVNRVYTSCSRSRAIVVCVVFVTYTAFVLGHLLIKADERWPKLSPTPEHRNLLQGSDVPTAGNLQQPSDTVVDTDQSGTPSQEQEDADDGPVATIISFRGIEEV